MIKENIKGGVLREKNEPLIKAWEAGLWNSWWRSLTPTWPRVRKNIYHRRSLRIYRTYWPFVTSGDQRILAYLHFRWFVWLSTTRQGFWKRIDLPPPLHSIVNYIIRKAAVTLKVATLASLLHIQYGTIQSWLHTDKKTSNDSSFTSASYHVYKKKTFN